MMRDLRKTVSTAVRVYLREHGQKHELPEYWYHGTNRYFDHFTLSGMGRNWSQSELGV